VQKLFIFLVVFLLPVVAGAQVIETIAGNGIGGFLDNVTATAAELNGPNSLAVDARGNIYISDFYNNRIRKINTSGVITTIAGTGTSGFSGDNGPATLAELNHPDGIALDNSGNLFMSLAGHRIRKVNTDGIITTIAGTGAPGYNGDEIPATSAMLWDPYVGATDNSGNLFFSDYNNHRVRKITPSGVITTIAGNGTNSSAGDNGPATAASLGGPCWLFVNASSEIYVPDNIFRCIRKVDAAGIITTFAGGGTSGYGDGGPALSATFTLPNSITFDHAGNAYIADYGASVVRKVNTAGIITRVAGTGTSGYNGDGIPATSTQISPNTVTCDLSGNLYIADINNNRIRRITYDATEVNDLTGLTTSVSIYPNPARDKITINTGEQIDRVDIVNLIGQVVTSPRPSPRERVLSIDVSDLPDGIYFVKVNGVYAGRFVKE
jgi:sugar lactone lactonase YvrE